MYKNKKIGIIGAGDIGLNLAQIAALNGFDVILYNRYHEVDGKAGPYWLQKLGKIMDMNDSLQMPHQGFVELTPNIASLRDADFIVITAGAKRTRPDETREELARKNAEIIRRHCSFLAASPNSLILVISNPVDALTQCLIYDLCELTGERRREVAKRVVGVSLIDSLRLKNLVSEATRKKNIIDGKIEVEGVALGEHGPTMIPVMSGVRVNGKKLSDILNNDEINSIKQHTILRGNDIIRLTGNSSVIGPSHAVLNMINLIEADENVKIPCSVWDGDRVIGSYAAFEKMRFTEIINVEVNEEEANLINKSKETLDRQFREIYYHEKRENKISE